MTLQIPKYVETCRNLVEIGHCSIWWNTVISQFGGTQSFSFWWNMVISKTHFETAILEKSLSESHEAKAMKFQWNMVNFSILWNMTISQCGGTWSLLNLVEHSHCSIWWNTVISQFGGTQSFSSVVHMVISQLGGTESFSSLVEHGHFSILWNTVILILVEHGHFLVW